VERFFIVFFKAVSAANSALKAKFKYYNRRGREFLDSTVGKDFRIERNVL